MSYTNLFSTPEQGKRLAELIPSLKSEFMHVRMYDKNLLTTYWVLKEFRHLIAFPALTLQELRDVVSKLILDHIGKGFASIDNDEFEYNLSIMTAPELAAWVIERLEATP